MFVAVSQSLKRISLIDLCHPADDSPRQIPAAYDDMKRKCLPTAVVLPAQGVSVSPSCRRMASYGLLLLGVCGLMDTSYKTNISMRIFMDRTSCRPV